MYQFRTSFGTGMPARSGYTRPVGTGYVAPITTRNYIPMTESQRLLAQQNPSTFVNRQEVTILPGGGDVPLITVGNTPASLTTIQRQTTVLYAENDPYNPATRFSQYFPKQPPGIPCFPKTQIASNGPVPYQNSNNFRNYPQYANNAPQAAIVPCVGGTGRFTGVVATTDPVVGGQTTQVVAGLGIENLNPV
jgi:hypothetical protein